jgi:hypothetical protein
MGVLIDGEKVGTIRQGQRHAFPVTPGVHRIQLKVSLISHSGIPYRSPEEVATVNAGEYISFICYSGFDDLKTTSITYWKQAVSVNTYIKLERE